MEEAFLIADFGMNLKIAVLSERSQTEKEDILYDSTQIKF